MPHEIPGHCLHLSPPTPQSCPFSLPPLLTKSPFLFYSSRVHGLLQVCQDLVETKNFHFLGSNPCLAFLVGLVHRINPLLELSLFVTLVIHQFLSHTGSRRNHGCRVKLSQLVSCCWEMRYRQYTVTCIAVQYIIRNDTIAVVVVVVVFIGMTIVLLRPSGNTRF